MYKILSNALLRVKKYHGKILVIKYGGSIMLEESLKKSFIQDVVLLQSIGIKPIIVHGGGSRINEVLQKTGKTTNFIQGMRITDDETMRTVEWVLSGEIQQEIVMLINHFHGKAIGLSGKDGKLIHAKKMLIPDKKKNGTFLDIGFVGDILSINTEIINILQKNCFIPVISPIGFDQFGKTYNINADLVASKIACSLKAEKLIIMTNTCGILNKQGSSFSKLSIKEIEILISNNTIFGGMIPKIYSAMEAIKTGISSVHITDGRFEHSLLSSVFGKKGTGTVLHL